MSDITMDTPEQTRAKWEAEKAANREIPQDEFCARFKAHMVARMGTKFDDTEDGPGGSIEAYADEVAKEYWTDPEQRQDGPEECADSDISYWGE